MNIQFTKMHGLGNDFIMIENMNGRISLSKEQIIFLCDRHFGIGADGVILIESSDQADCFMNYYNSDGSIVEMCGSGVRCVAKFLKDDIKLSQNNFKIDTRSGIKEIECLPDETFSVNMGKPIFSSTDFPDKSLEIEGLHWNFVSMGNPHAVAFVNNIDDYELSVIGPRVENNSNFPNRINVEIAEQKNQMEFRGKIWERGSGATLSSGTGSSAVYAAARRYKNADQEASISFPGGKLSFNEDDGDIIMRGPAVSVFSSMISI